jgi:pimeloyl-[acyl-carrier protein] methyl ester esterase
MSNITRRLFAIVSTVFALGLAAARAQAQDFTPTRFTVEVRGHGSDVILIPGLASSRDVWSAEAADLVAAHRVHLVQLNGFAGQPAPAQTDAILTTTVDELDRYIAANHIDHPAAIGHSMGGLMGLMLARAHPDHVGRLLIVDSLPFFSAMFGPSVTVAQVEPQAAALRGQVAAMDDASFAAQQQGGIARLVRTPEKRQQVIDWSIASNRAVVAQAMYEVMTTDMRPEVAHVTTPLTVLYAYAPEMGPQAMIDGLYQAGYGGAPNARLVRIDNAFHFIMLDQPAAFSAAVADFLR